MWARSSSDLPLEWWLGEGTPQNPYIPWILIDHLRQLQEKGLPKDRRLL